MRNDRLIDLNTRRRLIGIPLANSELALSELALPQLTRSCARLEQKFKGLTGSIGSLRACGFRP